MPKPTERDTDIHGRFTIPSDIRRRSVVLDKSDVRMKVGPIEVMKMMTTADKALNGNSNDGEHDALVELRDWLSDVYEDPDRRTTR